MTFIIKRPQIVNLELEDLAGLEGFKTAEYIEKLEAMCLRLADKCACQAFGPKVRIRCPKCKGSGYTDEGSGIAEDECGQCFGEGRVYTV